MADDGLWKVTKVPRANGGRIESGRVVALFDGCVIRPAQLREIIPNPFEEEDVD